MRVQETPPGTKYIAVEATGAQSYNGYARRTYLVMEGRDRIGFYNHPDADPMFTADFDHFERQLDKALDEPASGKDILVTVQRPWHGGGGKLRLSPTTRNRDIITAPCGERFHVAFKDLDEVYRLLPELRAAAR